jgi:hypothetical protein
MERYNKSLGELSNYLGLEHDLAEFSNLILEADMVRHLSSSDNKYLIVRSEETGQNSIQDLVAWRKIICRKAWAVYRSHCTILEDLQKA